MTERAPSGDMHRRGFVAAAGAVVGSAVAGCTGDDFQAAADPWEDGGPGESIEDASAGFALASGEYAPWRFEVETRREFEYAVEATARLEVIVMERSEFDAYRRREEITHFAELHGTGEGPAERGRIPAGEHVLVLDNTDFGAVEPGGATEGTIDADARS